MAHLEHVFPVVVNLTRSQAAVLAGAVVVVTSSLDCKEVNAADQGLLVFRLAVAHALANETSSEPARQPRRRVG